MLMYIADIQHSPLQHKERGIHHCLMSASSFSDVPWMWPHVTPSPLRWDVYSCYLSSRARQRLQGGETKVRRTPHSLTHRCLLTGVRTSVPTTDGLRWRCSSTTDITATSAIASPWTDRRRTWGLMGKTVPVTPKVNYHVHEDLLISSRSHFNGVQVEYSSPVFQRCSHSTTQMFMQRSVKYEIAVRWWINRVELV